MMRPDGTCLRDFPKVLERCANTGYLCGKATGNSVGGPAFGWGRVSGNP